MGQIPYFRQIISMFWGVTTPSSGLLYEEIFKVLIDKL